MAADEDDDDSVDEDDEFEGDVSQVRQPLAGCVCCWILVVAPSCLCDGSLSASCFTSTISSSS